MGYSIITDEEEEQTMDSEVLFDYIKRAGGNGIFFEDRTHMTDHPSGYNGEWICHDTFNDTIIAAPTLEELCDNLGD